MTISDSTLAELIAFRRERDWEQFHNLRTLASALVVEASELLELVQWTADTDLAQRVAERRADIEQELADVTILLSYVAHDLGVDLDAAVRRKLVLNAARYPVDKARGNSRKHSEL